MTDRPLITYAKLVPWSTQDPRAPSDLTGWAMVPLQHSELPDPADLEQRLRDLTPDPWLDSEGERAYATSLRDELIAERGCPTRPFRTFDASQANPESVALYDVEHGLFELYFNGSSYWKDELKSWRDFQKFRRRKLGSERTHQAGVLPDYERTDKAGVFMEYLAYQEGKIRNFDRKQDQLKKNGLSLDSKWDRVAFGGKAGFHTTAIDEYSA